MNALEQFFVDFFPLWSGTNRMENVLKGFFDLFLACVKMELTHKLIEEGRREKERKEKKALCWSLLSSFFVFCFVSLSFLTPISTKYSHQVINHPIHADLCVCKPNL